MKFTKIFYYNTVPKNIGVKYIKQLINVLGPISTYINPFSSGVKNYTPGNIINFSCDNDTDKYFLPVQIIGYGHFRGYPFWLIHSN